MQRNTKKWIKNKIGLSNAYCDEYPEPLSSICERYVCNAFELAEEGELNDHLDLTGCEDKFDIPDDDDEIEDTEAENWKEINQEKAYLYIKEVAKTAKRLCHKEKQNGIPLQDDYCKNKVECLTLEALSTSWPNLFALKNCDQETLDRYGRKVPKGNIDFVKENEDDDE